MSLYDAIGGPRSVRTAVDVFYRRVLDDPALRGFFEDVDVSRLAAHQRSFLATALGGPDLYGGQGLAAAHAGLGIDDAAFDALSAHLIATLRDLGTEGTALTEAIERIEAFRDDVVGTRVPPTE